MKKYYKRSGKGEVYSPLELSEIEVKSIVIHGNQEYIKHVVVPEEESYLEPVFDDSESIWNEQIDAINDKIIKLQTTKTRI